MTLEERMNHSRMVFFAAVCAAGLVLGTPRTSQAQAVDATTSDLSSDIAAASDQLSSAPGDSTLVAAQDIGATTLDVNIQSSDAPIDSIAVQEQAANNLDGSSDLGQDIQAAAGADSLGVQDSTTTAAADNLNGEIASVPEQQSLAHANDQSQTQEMNVDDGTVAQLGDLNVDPSNVSGTLNDVAAANASFNLTSTDGLVAADGSDHSATQELSVAASPSPEASPSDTLGGISLDAQAAENASLVAEPSPTEVPQSDTAIAELEPPVDSSPTDSFAPTDSAIASDTAVATDIASPWDTSSPLASDSALPSDTALATPADSVIASPSVSAVASATP
jgi:hypothetical protein